MSGDRSALIRGPDLVPPSRVGSAPWPGSRWTRSRRRSGSTPTGSPDRPALPPLRRRGPPRRLDGRRDPPRPGRALLSHHGRRDVESGAPVTDDTLWRIYSMTKPITSVAAMMLYEQGAFELTDPIARWIPAFADARVYKAGSAQSAATVPATEPVRVWHLLTHTSGLTYGFHHAHPVDEMYRPRATSSRDPTGVDLAAACESFAAVPAAVPAGHRVELRRVHRRARPRRRGGLRAVARRVLRRAHLRPARHGRHRLVRGRGRRRPARRRSTWPVPAASCATRALGDAATRPPALLAGGGGLVSTAGDYHRFTQMLLRGGELDGARLLGPRTVAYMTRNHLPGGVDLETFGRPIFAETSYRGVGFGLGFSVVDDAAAGKVLTSPGEYAWGGAGQHRVLRRPGRGRHGDVLHAVPALERVPDPVAAADARPAGDRGLKVD